VPPRLVAACEGGHIEDFPWRWWVGCHDSHHVLELHPNVGESDLAVICPECRKKKPTKDDPTPGFRTLRGALGALNLKCNGRRPWIGDDLAEEACDRKLHGLMRSGSNVYFPLTKSSILIPKFSYRIFQKVIAAPDLDFVKRGYDLVHGNVDDPTFVAMLNFTIDRYRKGYIEGDHAEYTEDDFKNAFLTYCRPRAGLSIKEEEWYSFYDPEPAPKKGDEVEFDAERLSLSDHPFLRQYFDKVVLITRLSEVRAEYGFTRINPIMKGMSYSDLESTQPAIARIREIDEARWQDILEEMSQGSEGRSGYKGLLKIDQQGNACPVTRETGYLE
jgi:hypothetical protein